MLEKKNPLENSKKKHGMVGVGKAVASRAGAAVADASCELQAATGNRGQKRGNCK